MDLLVPPVQKPAPVKFNLKKSESNSTDSTDQLQMSTAKSQEENLNPTSATSSKSIESVEPSPKPDDISHVTTKAEANGAKEISNCFCCFWIFPQSFRGEEKNMHIDRCMEGLGDKDKRLWSRCHGDLKQYRHGFNVDQWGAAPKPRTTKARKPTAKEKAAAEEAVIENEELEPPKTKKKATKKDDANDNIKDSVKSGARAKDEAEENKCEMEIQMTKKTKANEQKGKTLKTETEVQKIPLPGFTRIVAVPLVTELVFNPSKEFEKYLKKL